MMNLYYRLEDSMKENGLGHGRKDTLLCPICWGFTHIDDLTVEHILPQSIGGSLTTLTCRKCNNELGHEIDYHASSFHNSLDLLAGEKSFRGEVSVDDIRLRCNFSRNKTGWNIEIVDKANNPKEVETLQNRRPPKAGEKWNIKLFDWYDSIKLKQSLLKSSYLLLFNKYGYEYAKLPINWHIRRSIVTGESVIKDWSHLVRHIEEDLPFNRNIILLEGDDHLGHRLCVILLKGQKETAKWHIVMLPRCDIGVKEMNEVIEWVKTDSSFKISW